MHYRINLSGVAHQQKGIAYCYDRCYFLKLSRFSINYTSNQFSVPKNIYPTFSLKCLIYGLSKSALCVSKQTPGLLFYRLVLEAFGVTSIVSRVEPVRNEYQEVSCFNLFYNKQLNFCFLFEHLGTVSVLLRSLSALLNPVYTTQSSLYTVEEHLTGFCLKGWRLDSFTYLKWFDLIQSLFDFSNLSVGFNLQYNKWLLRLLYLFLRNNTSKSKLVQNKVISFFSVFLGIHPRYFSYKKIISGLSFKIIYTDQTRVRYLK